MNEVLRICLIVCPLVFLAGFIDSVAGGGGIISIPAYFLAGIPTRMALGTNKFAMSFGTALSTYKYMKSGKVLIKVSLISAVGSIFGSAIGTNLALIIDEDALKIVLLVVLPLVAVFLAVKKSFGAAGDSDLKYSGMKLITTSFVIGLFIGCYDGLVGPGTGTFLIMAFSGVLGMDLLKASGCAKVSNLASNITSLIIYAISGEIMYLVAIPAAVFCMCGNFIGARFAIKGGSENIRKVMLLVLALMIAKVGLDMYGISFG